MTLTHETGAEPMFATPIPLLRNEEDTLQGIHERITSIEAKLDEQIRLVKLIVDNVTPALDAISESPVGAMFGLKRKP